MRRLLGLITLFLMIACSNENTEGIRIIAGSGKPGFTDGEKAELNKPIRLAPYTANSIVFILSLEAIFSIVAKKSSELSFAPSLVSFASSSALL